MRPRNLPKFSDNLKLYLPKFSFFPDPQIDIQASQDHEKALLHRPVRGFPIQP